MPVLNITNQTLINQTLLNETLTNITLPVNETIIPIINQTLINQTAITEMQLKMEGMETKNTELENRIAVLESMIEQANNSVIIRFG